MTDQDWFHESLVPLCLSFFLSLSPTLFFRLIPWSTEALCVHFPAWASKTWMGRHSASSLPRETRRVPTAYVNRASPLSWGFIGYLCKPRNISLFLSSIFLSATFFLYLSLNLFADTVSLEGTPVSCGGWSLANCARTGTQKDSTSPVWIPDRLTHHVTVPWALGFPIASTTKEKEHSSAPASAAHLESPADSKTTSSRDPKKPPTKQISWLYIKDCGPP